MFMLLLEQVTLIYYHNINNLSIDVINNRKGCDKMDDEILTMQDIMLRIDKINDILTRNAQEQFLTDDECKALTWFYETSKKGMEQG